MKPTKVNKRDFEFHRKLRKLRELRELSLTSTKPKSDKPCLRCGKCICSCLISVFVPV